MTSILAAVFPIVLAGAAIVAPRPDAPPVVVVELFTSQGCSSCPQADEILNDLGADAGVLPLAFHVDYWDGLGWPDPFSSSAWSARQRKYAATLGGGSYTPEAVVNGATGMVGSRGDSLKKAIADAKKSPLARLVVSATAKGDAVLVKTDAAGDGALFVAIVENGLVTQIGRGENGGLKLRNDYVVRALEPMDAKERTLTLEKSWKRENVRVAVFQQDPKTLKMKAASALTKLE